MRFSINREKLLQPLSLAASVVERRQTMAVLSNLLVIVDGGKLSFTGSDLEVEIISHVSVDEFENGTTTVPARKLLEVIKNLPDGALVHFEVKNNKAVVKSDKARFSLACLDSDSYPLLEPDSFHNSVDLPVSEFKTVLDKTAFSIALQDVRFFLNGLLFEFKESRLRCVATDGHRLAAADMKSEISIEQEKSVIVPRKGVYEILRSIDGVSGTVQISLSPNHIQLRREGLILTSKLIDGQFPDYKSVIPAYPELEVLVNRSDMINVLRRAAILSNEKFRGVRVEIDQNLMTVSANNPEREEAKDELAVEYSGEKLVIGFNFTYLLEALSSLEGEIIKLAFRDAASSCLITEIENDLIRHVVMPIKL